MQPPMNALIAGASGIIGRSTARSLSHAGADVKGLARRAIAGLDTVQTDLRDRPATIEAIAHQATDTAHPFYATLAPHANLSVEA